MLEYLSLNCCSERFQLRTQSPVIYTLRIPEFRRAWRLACCRPQAAINKEGHIRRDNKAASEKSVNKLRAFETNLNHLELMTGDYDTKL